MKLWFAFYSGCRCSLLAVNSDDCPERCRDHDHGWRMGSPTLIDVHPDYRPGWYLHGEDAPHD